MLVDCADESMVTQFRLLQIQLACELRGKCADSEKASSGAVKLLEP